MLRHALLILTALSGVWTVALGQDNSAPSKPISFHREIRPILQAHCQGCHQPAKRGGDYVMTSYEHVIQPGESGETVIVPGKPDASFFVAQITPHEGQTAMPKDGEPLSQTEIDLIRLWIEQGAPDDTPENARVRYDQDHPPVYSQPPLITSLDFSPDGSLLAIAGFHEVLLRSADGSQLLARLIGEAERIESVRFSPDGKRLAVAGGQPCRIGELQIWNVESHELELSVPLTFDTIYGASWSPDGKLVAVGGNDKTVRAFDSTTGQQVFFNGTHDDWVLDTVFSVDGSKLISVGRDMSTKLYDVATQRFIDNVTSITPGALKGGLAAVDRHPHADVILVGGADGTPGIYRMERVTKRVIGDDANLIRRFPKMTGRIYSVAFSPDGKSIACGSSLDGQGQVFTYSCDVSFDMPDEIKRIVQTTVADQKAADKKLLEEFVVADAKLLTQTSVPAALYALAYRPDGQAIAAAGGDGRIRILNSQDGQFLSEFLPVDITPTAERTSEHTELTFVLQDERPTGPEDLPAGAQVAALEVVPESVHLHGRYDYAQLLVTGVLVTGERIDLTRLAKLERQGDAVSIAPLGRIFPRADGTSSIKVQFGSHVSQLPVEVSGVASPEPVNFVRDVNPVLTRVGCNQGTCHGAKNGKNGFKLSLRGYDPLEDMRAFTDDIKGRRTNTASADDSLMLLKATGVAPHVGGQLFQPGDAYFEILRRWIADGAKLNLDVERAVSIAIEPQNPVVQNLGARQQLRVVATYSNGITRDVTAEAFIESGNTEVAVTNRAGMVTAVRRGEAPLLARFEGKYIATTLTVMGDRTGFVWEQPDTWNEVDEFVAKKWERMKIAPSPLCSDADFLRRVFLDLTGLPPSAEEIIAFCNDQRPQRDKREEVIDQLVGSDQYVDCWTNKWSDLLQVNSKFLGTEGAVLFRNWIRQNVAQNRPYDEFCHEILTASGSNKEHPAASYFKILREPAAMLENSTHLFLAVRFNCNKCHDHPFERWTQDQYYETGAFFSQVGLQQDPLNTTGRIGGTAVEGSKPLWEEIFDRTDGEMTHDRTGRVTAPRVPFDRELPLPEGVSRREQLADWIVSPDNDYFARSYVNRMWGYLLGVGLIEPLDDIRAGNPPTNPELLDWLTQEFIASGFNVQQLMKTICNSRTYQLDISTNKWNQDDRLNYSHAVPKRLPAEVLYDAVYTVTGATMQIPGVPQGTRAAALPDHAIGLEDGFLDNLGRPARESACECERSTGLQLGPVMALMNGPTISQAISQPGNALEQLVRDEPDDSRLINQIFLRILNRSARHDDIAATLELMQQLRPEHEQLVRDLQAYEQVIAPTLAKKHAQWETAIAESERTLHAYEPESAQIMAAKEAERQQQIVADEQAIQDRLASAGERVSAWEQLQRRDLTPWSPLAFGKLDSTTGCDLELLEDRSILASGKNDAVGAYILEAPSELQTITAVRFEALADDRLPNLGPGRANDGDFLLSELTLQIIPSGAAEPGAPLTINRATADFAKDGNDIFKVIDDKRMDPYSGWAIGPQVGKNHVAVFELEQPVSIPAGSTLSVTLDQYHKDKNRSLGRFRISVTDVPRPVNFGQSRSVLDLVAVPPEQRTEAQRTQLVTEYVAQDAELQALRKMLDNRRKPLSADPKLIELQSELERRRRPLPEDPQLARLKRAVELSQDQLHNTRLTVAQDLAWALINSPAFLFNR